MELPVRVSPCPQPRRAIGTASRAGAGAPARLQGASMVRGQRPSERQAAPQPLSVSRSPGVNSSRAGQRALRNAGCAAALIGAAQTNSPSGLPRALPGAAAFLGLVRAAVVGRLEVPQASLPSWCCSRSPRASCPRAAEPIARDKQQVRAAALPAPRSPSCSPCPAAPALGVLSGQQRGEQPGCCLCAQGFAPAPLYEGRRHRHVHLPRRLVLQVGSLIQSVARSRSIHILIKPILTQ